MADGFAEGLVRREGGELFGLRLALVSQEVNQTQCLTLRSQLRALGVLWLDGARLVRPIDLADDQIGSAFAGLSQTWRPNPS